MARLFTLRVVVLCVSLSFLAQSLVATGDFGDKHAFLGAGLRVHAPAPVNDERLGQDVAVSGDLGLVAARDSAYIYEFRNGVWQAGPVLAPVDAPENWGPRAVDIDGNTAVLAGINRDPVTFTARGWVYVFRRDEQNPDLWHEILPPLTTIQSTPPETNLGLSVDIDGDLMALGALGEFHISKAIHLFERQPGTDQWDEIKVILGEGGGQEEVIPLALSGTTLLVGKGESAQGACPVPMSYGGAVYVHQRDEGGINEWGVADTLVADDCTKHFGNAVAFDGETILASGQFAHDYLGEVFVLEREAGNGPWVQKTILGAPELEDGDYFGVSIDVSGGLAVVGAFGDDDGCTGSCWQAGAVYAFQRDSSAIGGWREIGKAIQPEAGNNDALGLRVATSKGHVLAGAPSADGGCVSGGACIDSGSVLFTQVEMGNLHLPISGVDSSTSLLVSALHDHSVPTGFYCARRGVCDDLVVAMSGEVGELRHGLCGPISSPGYRKENGQPVHLGGAMTYVGATCVPPTAEPVSTYLNYDGHPGYDFAYPQGTGILAVADGWLDIPDSDPINGGDPSPHACFNTLRLVQDDGWESWYLHADPGSECERFTEAGVPCAVGGAVRVRRGDRIARVGNKGVQGCGVLADAGFHLHYELRRPSGAPAVAAASLSGEVDLLDPFGCTPEVRSLNPAACAGRFWKTPCDSTEDLEVSNTIVENDASYSSGGILTLGPVFSVAPGGSVTATGREAVSLGPDFTVAPDGLIEVLIEDDTCTESSS